MSATILHFTPRAELEPHTNLEAFIELCKKSEVLDAREQFESNVWKIGYLKGHNKLHRVVFSTLEAASEDVPEPSLPQPFLDFAKAAMVYLQDKRPVVSHGQRIAAFRCIEAALRDWSKDSRPTAVAPDILDTAVERAKKQFSPGVAYRVAGQIQIIADLMSSNGFISLRHPWVHVVKKPGELGSRISKEALAARQEKLPSSAVLRALAGIFHQAIEPSDVLVSSYTALMVCAPERINEVLRLRRNCLVDGDGEFSGKLGLRWAGSKGAEDTTKWLPSEMAPVAREAVANLLKTTEAAQQLAVWYAANPGKLYLHEGARHLRDKELLTNEELALVLWGTGNSRVSKVSANHWAQTKQLTRVLLDERRHGYPFAEIEHAVVSMLPKTFPYVPGAPSLRCEDALAVARTYELRSHATYLCMFHCVDYGMVASQLSAWGDRGSNSIFARFGYTEDDGSPIELATHSLRHYLNMLAQMGGLSSTEIAIFSGRKDVKQNRAYDHMSSDEVQAPISAALKAGFTSSLVSTGGRNIILRSEFKGIGIVAAHTTEYGWCTHNFASEPCQMYRDCINCEEQECVKGEEHREANLRLLKTETEYLLDQAREALSDEEYGADNWVKHQTKTLVRVNALPSILEDPSVPIGARIRLDLANAPLITKENARLPMDVKAIEPKVLR
jgi:hypothetical protein